MNTTAQKELIVTDPTGFPMIHVPSINAWLGWLPVTMIQLETFLCEQPEPRFNTSWYRALEHAESRVTPQQITSDILYRAFVTQLTPADIQRYCQWLTEKDKCEYRLPTSGEWVSAYRDLERTQKTPDPLSEVQSERTRILLTNVDSAIRQKLRIEKLSETIPLRMLMGSVVRELSMKNDQYVSHGREQWTEDNKPDRTEPDAVSKPYGRVSGLGFRLLRKCT